MRHIEATVHSILSQTYSDFELILSDHSSTDGTWEKLQALAADPRGAVDEDPGRVGSAGQLERGDCRGPR